MVISDNQYKLAITCVYIVNSQLLIAYSVRIGKGSPRNIF